ncbi:MAG: sugar-binding transcriptional regulator [Anaerolineales bacterium]|nr:sugar-binding transcriptional regulator [Anaerolineales bacterium]
MANNTERDELLAYVAEKYYLEDHKQTEIAEMIGLTRSAVSRMLTEARDKGIVEIVVHHPFQYDHKLEEKLQRQLGLKHIAVVDFNNQPSYDTLRKQLGKAGSRLLANLIKPGSQIGVAWGTTVQATIEAFEANPIPNAKVVQLVGVLGSTRHSYSAQTLVENLAQKVGGEGIYLYSPFIVENERTAASLMEDPSVEKAISIGKESDIALVGIGTTKPEFCSLFRGDHISSQELATIQSAKAVGDVCALYFNITGELVLVDFHQRRVGVSLENLKNIGTRVGVAGNPEKAEAILGAVCGGFINALVTDNLTALRVLDLAQIHCRELME